MKDFSKAVVLVGLLMLFGAVYYASSYGFGLAGIRNQRIIEQASRDCPNRDEYGNCIQKNYRSAYYTSYYYGGSAGGSGRAARSSGGGFGRGK